MFAFCERLTLRVSEQPSTRQRLAMINRLDTVLLETCVPLWCTPILPLVQFTCIDCACGPLSQRNPFQQGGQVGSAEDLFWVLFLSIVHRSHEPTSAVGRQNQHQQHNRMWLNTLKFTETFVGTESSNKQTVRCVCVCVCVCTSH